MVLTISRKASYQIITRAVQIDGQPLTGLLPIDADSYQPCADGDELLAGLREQPGAMIVYNQHPAARDLIDDFTFSPDQVFIEIRQDTKGVLGLHALRHGADGDETLELVYQ